MGGSLFNIKIVSVRLFVFSHWITGIVSWKVILCLLKCGHCLLPVCGLFIDGEFEQRFLMLLKSYLPVFPLMVLLKSRLENTSLPGGHENILLYYLLKVFKLYLSYVHLYLGLVFVSDRVG